MIGNFISHYKILEKIGTGGMGIVYKAEDTKLKRSVALKFLPPSFSLDDEAKQRFIHEAQAASALQHSNICTIYDIDETNEGQLFISMECYEGEVLSDKVKVKVEGKVEIETEIERLDIDGAIEIILQVAKGLSAAHEKGIVHRDIKPANIFITDKNEVKILDFGLAKVAGQTQLTQMGSTVGTAAYMSPEQARGEKVDQRTDIWSLGVVLYEMLTGEPPFKGEYDQALIYSIINSTPKPLQEDPTDGLQIVLDKCLAKDAEERYQKVDELIEDLDSLKEGSTITQRSKLKNKAAPLYIAAIVLIIIVLGYLFIPFGESDTRDLHAGQWENSIAVLPFDDLSPQGDQEWFCDGMTDQVISNLTKLPKLKVIARQSMMKFKATDKTISEIGQELNVSYILEGSINKISNQIRLSAKLINAEDEAYIWSEDYDKDYEELFNLQGEVSEKIAKSLLRKLSNEEITKVTEKKPKNNAAWEYYIKGNFNWEMFWRHPYNIEYYNKSEELLKKAIDLDPEYVLPYAVLANLYHFYFKYFASDDDKEKYLKLQEKYIEAGFAIDTQSADMYEAKGWYHTDQYDFQTAFDSFKKSVTLDSNNPEGNYALGLFFSRRALYNQSIRFLNKTIEVNPLHAYSFQVRSGIYRELGDYRQAELDILSALKIDPEMPSALMAYARILISMNRIEEAKETLKKIELIEFQPDGNTFYTKMARANLYALEGEKEKVFELYPDGGFWIFYVLKMKNECLDHLQNLTEEFEESERT